VGSSEFTKPLTSICPILTLSSSHSVSDLQFHPHSPSNNIQVQHSRNTQVSFFILLYIPAIFCSHAFTSKPLLLVLRNVTLFEIRQVLYSTPTGFEKPPRLLVYGHDCYRISIASYRILSPLLLLQALDYEIPFCVGVMRLTVCMFSVSRELRWRWRECTNYHLPPTSRQQHHKIASEPCLPERTGNYLESTRPYWSRFGRFRMTPVARACLREFRIDHWIRVSNESVTTADPTNGWTPRPRRRTDKSL
jgi:hypothetical protein